MSGIPLHPLIVHFPIVLSVLLPLAALTALALGFRSKTPRKYWPVVLVLNALLLVSSFVAVETGENEEETVEKALTSEAPLKTHEENAEVFIKATGAVLAASALGLAPGVLGLTGRAIGGVGALALLLLGIQVGHSGGALVYQHGAASAYVSKAAMGPAEGGTGEGTPEVAGKAGEKEGDDDDDD